jgi:DNA segregation ATPase FtsK/SpoIIIE-like protein
MGEQLMGKHYDRYRDELDSLASNKLAHLEDISFKHALAFVEEVNMVSISKIQRALRIGYNHAARLTERMESEGFVSKAGYDGRRSVLIHRYKACRRD